MTTKESFVILSDFDGTIVTLDLAAYALEVFVGEQWKIFDEMYVRNKITLKECIESQYTMFTNTKQEILAGIDDAIKFMPDFPDFVKFCRDKNITFEIVSAGLDFIIEHTLAKINLLNLTVYAVKAIEKEKSMEVSFIEDFYDPSSPDFKTDLVRRFKENYFVYYIGDGSSDFGAVMDADFTFAVKDSALSSFCEKKGIEFKEFLSFNDIKSYIESHHF